MPACSLTGLSSSVNLTHLHIAQGLSSHIMGCKPLPLSSYLLSPPHQEAWLHPVGAGGHVPIPGGAVVTRTDEVQATAPSCRLPSLSPSVSVSWVSQAFISTGNLSADHTPVAPPTALSQTHTPMSEAPCLGLYPSASHVWGPPPCPTGWLSPVCRHYILTQYVPVFPTKT